MQAISESALNELRAVVASRLGEYRFQHTLGVEETMARLGEIYLPYRIPALRAAGLLHDLTKEWSSEEQLAYCKENKIPVSPAELAAPRILHAKTGAHLASREFAAYTDPEMLFAIARHTIGAYEITLFDGLLYLADYIEPTRKFPECCRLREDFFEGVTGVGDPVMHLYQILIRAFSESIEEVKGHGGMVADETIGAISFLRECIKKRNIIT